MKKNLLILTGAKGGIGQAIVNEFKKHNKSIETICLDKEYKSVNKDENTYFIPADNMKFSEQKYLKEIFSAQPNNSFDQIFLVNNAATQIIKSFENISFSELNDIINVNALSSLLLFKYVKKIYSYNRLKVLNMSSVHSSVSKKNFGAYALSKSCLDALTRNMAIEYASERISIFGLAPAAVKTKMLNAGLLDNEKIIEKLDSYSPTGKISSAEEIAETAYKLLSIDAVNISGNIFRIDGGISNCLSDPSKE